MAAGAKEARDKRLRWWQLAKGWGEEWGWLEAERYFLADLV